MDEVIAPVPLAILVKADRVGTLCEMDLEGDVNCKTPSSDPKKHDQLLLKAVKERDEVA